MACVRTREGLTQRWVWARGEVQRVGGSLTPACWGKTHENKNAGRLCNCLTLDRIGYWPSLGVIGCSSPPWSCHGAGFALRFSCLSSFALRLRPRAWSQLSLVTCPRGICFALSPLPVDSRHSELGEPPTLPGHNPATTLHAPLSVRLRFSSCATSHLFISHRCIFGKAAQTGAFTPQEVLRAAPAKHAPKTRL